MFYILIIKRSSSSFLNALKNRVTRRRVRSELDGKFCPLVTVHHVGLCVESMDMDFNFLANPCVGARYGSKGMGHDPVFDVMKSQRGFLSGPGCCCEDSSMAMVTESICRFEVRVFDTLDERC